MKKYEYKNETKKKLRIKIKFTLQFKAQNEILTHKIIKQTRKKKQNLRGEWKKTKYMVAWDL